MREYPQFSPAPSCKTIGLAYWTSPFLQSFGRQWRITILHLHVLSGNTLFGPSPICLGFICPTP
jgi:hypothetical protein